MKVSAANAIGSIAVVVMLVSVLGSSSSTKRVNELDFGGPPHEHVMLYGYVYESDGVTPVLNSCIVNVSDETIGAWTLVETDPIYGFYMLETGLWGTHVDLGDIIKITATRGSQTGVNETVVTYPLQPYYQIDVTLSPPEQTYSLSLVRGWNQICIPFHNLSYRASNLGLSFGDAVTRFNSTTQQYDGSYIIGISPPSMDFAIELSIGYEVYVSAPRTLTLRGILSAFESRAIAVRTGGGWVELGLASPTPRHARDIPWMYSGGALMIIAMWDPIILAYKSYFPGIPIDFIIPPGQGFWAWATSNGTFSYVP